METAGTAQDIHLEVVFQVFHLQPTEIQEEGMSDLNAYSHTVLYSEF